MATLRFVTTQRGHRKVILDGYIYLLDKTHGQKTYWRCEDRSCTSRLHTLGDSVVRPPSEHLSHAPSSSRVTKALVMSDVRRLALDSETSTRNIVQQAIADVPTLAAPAIPSNAALSQIVRRKRQRQLDDGDDEDGSCVIPRRLQYTADGQRFLIHSGEILIFASERALSVLAAADHWFVDGTFNVAPPGYTQLYTIHALLGESTAVPCVFALLKDKSGTSYSTLLSHISDASSRGLAPRSILMDFEAAAISAFRERFSHATLKGCFYHLSQSIWRRVQEAGLQTRYAGDMEFALWCRCLPALAFVPEGDIFQAFEALIDAPGFPRELDSVVDYFESNYIGNINRGGRRRQPLFPPSLWTQYQRTVDGLPRTNNSVEGWHNAFSGSINKAHPSVRALALRLQREEASMAALSERLKAGDHPPMPHKKYRRVNERLKTVISGCKGA